MKIKGHKNKLISQTFKLTIPRYNIISDINFLDLDLNKRSRLTSRSNVIDVDALFRVL